MKWPASCSATIWVVGALIVLGLMLLLVEQPGLLLLEVIGALVLGGVFWGRGGSDHSGPTTPTEVQLVRGETAEVREVLEQLAALPPVEKEPLVLGSMKPLVTREEAEPQVADIKEAYGGLLSDVVYRITNSALFDPSVPQTREFTLLMAQWDDLPDDASETTAAELARALRIAFDTARANAEALGLTHLPSTARPPARRAVKAAPHLPSRTLPRPRGSPTLWQCPSSPRGRWSPPTRRSHGCRATPSCSPPATMRSCTSPS